MGGYSIMTKSIRRKSKQLRKQANNHSAYRQANGYWKKEMTRQAKYKDDQ